MEVVVPDLGDFADVEIIDVLVKPGDSVTAEQGLVTLETEKATMDVPAPAAGRVGELKVKVGDRVSTGHVIMSFEPDGGDKLAPPGSDRSATPRPVAAEPATKPPPPPSGNGTPRVVAVPDLGDFAGVEIIDVLVKPGDRVAAEQGLVTLETEKASMDVPAPEAGEIVELKIKVGDKVSAGDALLLLRPAAAAGAAPQRAEPAQAPKPSAAAGSAAPQASASASPSKPSRAPAPRAAAPSAVAATPTSFGDAHASPSVRKLARELGVELGRVRGSGHKQRVTAEDVKAFVKEIMQGRGGAGAALPAVPAVDFARFGPVETQPLTRIQKISGPRLHASWVNIPHVTQHDEADITDLEEKRASLKEQAQARGIKLTPLAFIVRACVLALDEMPLFKSSLSPDGESLIVKRYTHIGFAADTPNGLLVPVIRDADKKDVYELAQALATLSERARAGRLQADDIQGAVFTVSSLGGIGGRFFSPIINAPEVAILGVSRSQMQPVYRGSMFVPRLMLPLSLSYDHRVIDGAKAVRFTTRLGEILADPSKLVEATP
ncbi:MAG TPA: dihydrolipoyllysine-residue acetyltransferase [Gammaproteobacteria bacterium]|nr:dihydrolipoyllysine-residue acetyltransferase [Gammaproteobacteria bacterium]